MSDFIVEFVTGVVLWFAGAWLIMLELGAAHSYSGAVPAPGYLTVLWLVGALSSASYIVGRGIAQAFKE